jgi:ABC-type uncharacterized transport system ATPase subunit
MVHQHFMLIPKLSVTQNVILGKREASKTFTSEKKGSSGLLGTLGEMFSIDREGPREKIANLSSDYGFGIDPTEPVWQLEVGEQQRVEILKALYRDVDLLILDEPTAVLTPSEADQLFETLRELADDGLSIIFITHKLYEIMQITDRATILRDGKLIETVETAAMTETDLAERMVGHEVLFDLEKSELDSGDVAMEVSNLQAKDDRGLPAVKGVDVQIRSGEIVGIAGVSGNGQKELAECLVGVRDIEDGTLSVDGRDLTDAHPIEFIKEGISFIPEDRLKYGLAPDLPIMHNTGVKEYRKDRFQSGPFLDYGEMEDYTNEIIDEFDIRGINDPREMEAGDLSGGNMQKLIVGRESYRNPDVLIANQPTRGVDVGAIESIRRNLLEQRDKGMGILLVSEDLDEVLDMSDRILVVYEGEIVYETTPEEADKGEIGLKMTGGGASEASVATDGGQDNTANSDRNADIGDSGHTRGDQ